VVVGVVAGGVVVNVAFIISIQISIVVVVVVAAQFCSLSSLV